MQRLTDIEIATIRRTAKNLDAMSVKRRMIARQLGIGKSTLYRIMAGHWRTR